MRILKDIRDSEIFFGAIFLLSVIIFSFTVSGAVNDFNSRNRAVSVKGLSEKIVEADLALWPISSTATSNSLIEIHAKISEDQAAIKNFLIEQGFKENEITTKQPTIQDRQANVYYENNSNQLRYIADIGLLVKTNKVALVKKAMQKSADLISKNISLGNSSAEYIFSKLNDVKPEMIEEATKQARIAAKKFAQDSGSRIKGIKHADQGLFTMEPIHYYNPEIIKIRVVTNIDYYIK
jgi:hypothetical protein